jgi:hypothetical protein
MSAEEVEEVPDGCRLDPQFKHAVEHLEGRCGRESCRRALVDKGDPPF